MAENHYEILSCEHQNNLLLEYPDKSKNTPGVCPKGCNDVKVLQVVTVDGQLAEIEEPQTPD